MKKLGFFVATFVLFGAIVYLGFFWEPSSGSRLATPTISENSMHSPTGALPIEASARREEISQPPEPHTQDSIQQEIDVLSILQIAETPSPENLQKMAESLFSQPKPWEEIQKILIALTSGQLKDSQRNAAILALEFALQLFHREDWMALNGAEHGWGLVESVLRVFDLLDRDVRGRIGQLFAANYYLRPTHLAAIRRLIVLNPTPSGLEQLVIVFAEQNKTEGISFLLSLLEYENHALRATAMEFLLSSDPDGFLDLAELYLSTSKTDQERINYAKAVVKALDPTRSSPVLRRLARDYLQAVPGRDGSAFSALFVEAYLNAPVEFLWSEFEKETDPKVREAMLNSIRSTQVELPDRVVTNSRYREFHGVAIRVLSRLRPDEATANLTTSMLLSSRPSDLSDGLVAAYNLARKSKGAGWVSSLKTALLEIAAQVHYSVDMRRRALAACAPLLSSDEKASILGGGYPDEVKEGLRSE